MPDELIGQIAPARRLKQDTFGAVFQLNPAGSPVRILRDTRAAPWWARPVARWLMRREARAMGRLTDLSFVPTLYAVDRHRVEREFLEGTPMFEARPEEPGYFRAARRALHAVHRRGVTHNDLAKEPNWLVTDDGSPALIDFQLASVFTQRNARFRLQAREDIRHLLKHKRTYCPQQLTARERAILARPALATRLWHATGKRVYLFVTRRVLHWSDREGAADRGRG